ncbi:hypothetical protein TTHERM_000312029 (macronuclear) [Tetrahymena thermophila SB210]|uniref:Uncharacterized protein n=1 Tax=Tetrahymena thermophila (strain SB210) TaxID=312017 RepID=W7XE62_TETTS|nr:hypothetical protein TTHERM_000312029 [Tetrahymena thermophila SB210]EWS72231.1 hypothetical protein TTHERM_000312029 [Tetrahymena thermophila SB210]|eukprot:XP_012655171.1 hypothetical protein TTHERM_000312029 [Tetrahymena thermophila SB210]
MQKADDLFLYKDHKHLMAAVRSELKFRYKDTSLRRTNSSHLTIILKNPKISFLKKKINLKLKNKQKSNNMKKQNKKQTNKQINKNKIKSKQINKQIKLTNKIKNKIKIEYPQNKKINYKKINKQNKLLQAQLNLQLQNNFQIDKIYLLQIRITNINYCFFSFLTEINYFL